MHGAESIVIVDASEHLQTHVAWKIGFPIWLDEHYLWRQIFRNSYGVFDRMLAGHGIVIEKLDMICAGLKKSNCTGSNRILNHKRVGFATRFLPIGPLRPCGICKTKNNISISKSSRSHNTKNTARTSYAGNIADIFA